MLRHVSVALSLEAGGLATEFHRLHVWYFHIYILEEFLLEDIIFGNVLPSATAFDVKFSQYRKGRC